MRLLCIDKFEHFEQLYYRDLSKAQNECGRTMVITRV